MTALAFSPNPNGDLPVARRSGSIQVVDTESVDVRGHFEDSADAAVSIVFDQTDQVFAAASARGVLRFYGLRHAAPFEHHQRIIDTTFSPKLLGFATTTGGNHLRIFALEMGELFKDIEMPSAVLSMAFLGNGQELANIRMTGAVAITADGQHLVFGDANGYVTLTSVEGSISTVGEPQHQWDLGAPVERSPSHLAEA